jgi:hypothetical protein
MGLAISALLRVDKHSHTTTVGTDQDDVRAGGLDLRYPAIRLLEKLVTMHAGSIRFQFELA